MDTINILHFIFFQQISAAYPNVFMCNRVINSTGYLKTCKHIHSLILRSQGNIILLSIRQHEKCHAICLLYLSKAEINSKTESLYSFKLSSFHFLVSNSYPVLSGQFVTKVSLSSSLASMFK